MDSFACGELLDGWIIGFEFKKNQKQGLQEIFHKKHFRFPACGVFLQNSLFCNNPYNPGIQ
jgi:hypothetical protein